MAAQPPLDADDGNDEKGTRGSNCPGNSTQTIESPLPSLPVKPSPLQATATATADIGDANAPPLNSTAYSMVIDDDYTATVLQHWKDSVRGFLEEPLVEVFEFVLVLGSSLLVAVSTLPALPAELVTPIYFAEYYIGLTFAVEFALRWFASRAGPGKHFAQPLVWIDIVAVILPLVFASGSDTFWNGVQWVPDWLTSSSGLINLRLLRILRLSRVLQDMETFTKFEMALGIASSNVKPWQLQLARTVLSIFTLLSVSTGLIYTVEHGVNPDIPDYFTALYFGLTTLTTLGYGDITPVTWQGKLVVSGSILAGVAIIPAQAAGLVEALLAREEDRRETRQQIQDELDNDAGEDTTDLIPTVKRKAVNGPNTSGLLNNNSRQGDGSGRMVLETALACTNCSATMHWSGARYCWSCGDEL